MKKSIPQAQRACYCGADSNYGSCCGQYIHGKKVPETPEALMRSRYSANCRKAFKYLAETWHKETRPKKLGGSTGLDWVNLEVIEAKVEADQAWIEFKATYDHGGHHTHSMHEKSRFLHQDGRWWYYDGEILHKDHCGAAS